MPISKVAQEWELTTRNQSTKIEAEISLKINGREIPNLSILGECVEQAIAAIQERVTESYKIIPERV